MRHDSSIPQELHVEASADLKDALGSFWSSVFSDQDLVDAVLTSKVLSASQLYIDIMEALSLRDHTGSPVFHRSHWHPLVVRLSERNTGRGISFGMSDTPTVGEQKSDSVYLPGEVFQVGGNATYSKVNTYPVHAMTGCPLVGVRTCICDSISSPNSILVQDRDFTVCDGVFTVRKERDPFEVDGYRIVPDRDDRIAVLWMCDAEFDTGNVGSFIGYPLGFDVKSTDASSRIMSALWDVLVFGITPRYLNAALGALFDVQVVPADTTVESVTDDPTTGVSTVVTGDSVYCIPTANLASAVTEGAVLRAGSFLTDDIAVYNGLSKDELVTLSGLVPVGGLALPPGSVYGVDKSVVLENRQSTLETGGWFKLNSGDTGDSPFWTEVRGKNTVERLTELFSDLSDGLKDDDGNAVVNPLLSVGYMAMANTILVRTDKALCSDQCASAAFSFLRSLVPAYASLVVVHTVAADETMATAGDSVSYKFAILPGDITTAMAEASDDVSYRLVPVPATEV